MSADVTGDFTSSLNCLVEPILTGLAAELDAITELAPAERVAIRDGVADALYQAARLKVSRVLVLELNAARVTGRLTAGDPEARWSEFLSMTAELRYWESLNEHYPTMLTRLRTMLAGRCAEALVMARRLVADRDALAELFHAGPGESAGAGELVKVGVGAGDTHDGGSVTVLEFTTGRVVYKPRSLDVDRALGKMLPEVFGELPAENRIRVPGVVPRPGYGWAEHVAHRYCAGPEELSAFYRGIGHWLAVMRLLSGTDLHLENVIASGPVPVVIDCETLFTPPPALAPSGFGLAVDRASALVNETVLRSGLLPNRGVALGWRGVDFSAVGALPDQQPATMLPVILDAGSDRARIGFRPMPSGNSPSHPSPAPALAPYWHRVLAGFTEATATLRAMDRAGRLRPLLDRFGDCSIRVVLRATETYAEVGRMLWHPVSLHDPAAATQRAVDLLATMARSAPSAPGDPRVIAAEVADLLVGDVPRFTTVARHGRLTGPAGTTWLPESDLVAGALTRWRDADLELDRRVIEATLVSAYLNEGWTPGERRAPAAETRVSDVERRRRDLAAALVRHIGDTAFHAEDGTVTWVAPVLHAAGWSVQPLSQDLYGGLPGVAVLLAGYRREAAAGRADAVEGVPALLDAVLRTMRRADDVLERAYGSAVRLRPQAPGGYIGLGSRIWAWLTLHRMAATGSDGIERARWQARQLPAAVAGDDRFELLTGMAGAIVPLLGLAAVTGEDRWTDQAVAIGERLVAAARWDANTACWTSPLWPAGLGGFGHGSTGVGWSLARLALATGDSRFTRTAQAAFAFEEALYDDTEGGWRDLRSLPGGPDGQPATAAAWCHGAVGIGLAAVDLARRDWSVRQMTDVLGRAAAAAYRHGLGWNHTLCHGDLGCWELLDAALTDGAAPAGLTSAALTARVVDAFQDEVLVTGEVGGPFSPGLLTGTGGMAYQLLRLHTAVDLPSVLTLT